MWTRFLLCIQFYQDQNIAESSFVTVDKYQDCLKITSATRKFSNSVTCFDIFFLLINYRENSQHWKLHQQLIFGNQFHVALFLRQQPDVY